jgi:hypothetical protein
MNLQGAESFLLQLRVVMALMQEAQDEHCASFQNVVDLAKTIEAGDEQLAQFQNQMGLMEEAKKNPETDEFNEDGGREMAFGAYRTDGRRSSIHGVPRQDEDTEEIPHYSLQCCSREKEENFNQPNPCVPDATPKRQSREIQDRI